MISDWSGAAIEFAFATKRLVIFINTKPKINNKIGKINLPCEERSEIKSVKLLKKNYVYLKL